MTKALLVIDMLNDFVLPGAPLEVPRTREMLPRLAQRLAAARQAGLAVIYVCDAHQPDDREFVRMGWPPHALAGSPGAEVVAALAPQAGEPVVVKQTYSGFYGTGLETLLQGLGVEELILTGCVTNICILYTAADAVMRGFRVQVPVDSVADLDPAQGAFALQQMQRVLGVTLEQ